jgi:glycosyltransferase involved in cell wall biosynthesis
VRIYAAVINHFLRFYDYLTSQKVDLFIANSIQVAGRIRKFYRRESVIVNPPIDLPKKISKSDKNYYLFISRLVSYKHPDLAAEACGQLGVKLIIAGDGPLRSEVEDLAKKYKNVEYLGRVSDSRLKTLYKNCKCLIYPVESEDFGMVPLEAAGFGKPTIAFYSGGAKETVIEGVSGLFCKDFSLESLKNKIAEFEEKKDKFDPQKIRLQAEKRSYSNFSKNILKVIKKVGR